MTLFLTATAAFCIVWIIHFLFHKVVEISISYEMKELSRSAVALDAEHVRCLGLLESLQVTESAIFTAFSPLMCLVIGTLFPDPVRAIIVSVLGPASILTISIAVICAYFAAFRIWRRHIGDKLWKHILEMLFGSAKHDEEVVVLAPLPDPPPRPAASQKKVNPAARPARAR